MKDNSKRTRITIIYLLTVIFFTAIALQGSIVDPALAQADGEDFFNYAYAIWLGSGYYKVGEQTVWILRAPFSYKLREAEENQWGLKLQLPVVFGFHEFDVIPETLTTAAFVPGVELSYQVNKKWRLNPFGQIGVGKDFSGGNWALIYGAGIRSLAVFPWRNFDFSLGNSLIFASQRVSGVGLDDGFSMVEIGLDVRHPLNLRIRDRNIDASVYFVYSEFVDDLQILVPGLNELIVKNLYQVGLTFGVDKPVSLWKFKFPRVGIAYMSGKTDETDNPLKAIRLSAGFPF
jgi:hypothetical protein